MTLSTTKQVIGCVACSAIAIAVMLGGDYLISSKPKTKEKAAVAYEEPAEEPGSFKPGMAVSTSEEASQLKIKLVENGVLHVQVYDAAVLFAVDIAGEAILISSPKTGDTKITATASTITLHQGETIMEAENVLRLIKENRLLMSVKRLGYLDDLQSFPSEKVQGSLKPLGGGNTTTPQKPPITASKPPVKPGPKKIEIVE